ncbi:capsular polysaccharide synthesis protein [Phocaeicola plebeius]|jgi:hypothetical protein|uniref:capsular polysaccharide synthesis protein n=1 Tax=Phocaeicola plebeius TaxID=310297 RepID=UPI0026F20E29|nr:capsular polysaccharide synthesis protein [Phocaeicola plebeius]
MISSINKLKRFISNFILMASEFNLRIAIADYLYRIAYMLGIMNSCIGKLIVKNMHSTKTKYLKKEYYYLIEKYHKIEAAKKISNETIKSESPIWVCWWQGKELMPEVTKICYETISKHSCHHPVILIDKTNFQNYVDIPGCILEKVKNGHITITHLSDIIRLCLLSKYGGIWIDSTIYLNQDIDAFIPIETPFYSYKHFPQDYNIVRGKWSGYFIASGKNNFLISFIKEMIIEFYKKHNQLLDYLLMDYVFEIGYQQYSTSKAMVDRLPTEQCDMNYLLDHIIQPYNEENYNIHIKPSKIQKLSYKIQLIEQDNSGRITYYGYIKNQYKNEHINYSTRI